MPIGPTFGSNLLQLVFQAKPITNIADNTVTSPATNLWASLHTAAPTSDVQTGNEAAYTSYARIAIARTTVAWTVVAASSAGANSTVTPLSAVNFPQATAGSETETYFAVGLSSVGAGKILVSGSISPTIAVANGVTPQLTTASTITIT